MTFASRAATGRVSGRFRDCRDPGSALADPGSAEDMGVETPQVRS
jgi:hypothetical protein